MGQSSELGWAHKKSSNNVSSPIMDHNAQIKLTLIYDIIKIDYVSPYIKIPTILPLELHNQTSQHTQS